MPTPPTARTDLYNELRRVLGSDHADTLMAYLPEDDPRNLATRSDLESLEQRLDSGLDSLRGEMTALRTELRTEMGELRTEMGGLRTELRTEMGGLRTEMGGLRAELRGELTDYRHEFHGDLLAINQRLDRLFLALVSGLFLVVVTFITGMFFG